MDLFISEARSELKHGADENECNVSMNNQKEDNIITNSSSNDHLKYRDCITGGDDNNMVTASLSEAQCPCNEHEESTTHATADIQSHFIGKNNSIDANSKDYEDEISNSDVSDDCERITVEVEPHQFPECNLRDKLHQHIPVYDFNNQVHEESSSSETTNPPGDLDISEENMVVEDTGELDPATFEFDEGMLDGAEPGSDFAHREDDEHPVNSDMTRFDESILHISSVDDSHGLYAPSFMCDTASDYLISTRSIDGKERGNICPHCNKVFVYKNSLKPHILTVHKKLKPYQCQHCDKSFGVPDGLRRHVATVHEKQRPYPCMHCDKAYANVGGLKKHVLTIHEKKELEKPHICSLCNKPFSMFANLKSHIEVVHEKRKPYICIYCCKSFGLLNGLKSHITAVHEKLKPYSCTLCDKSFCESKNLRLHVATVHERKKPYSCKVCNKSFGRSHNLKSHVATVHEKRRLHVCAYCEKPFGAGGDLKKHIMTVHEKQKPFICSHCYKPFAQAGHLRVHVAIVHEKQKPNPCPYCDKSFGYSSSLKLHVARIHEKHLPYVCPSCEKPFPRPGDLRRHATSVHGLTGLIICRKTSEKT